ncbi:dihydrofolate reductase [Pseudomonas phage hairong]|nr:dihydrofolate reductase [Pseudomonas phage hairong]
MSLAKQLSIAITTDGDIGDGDDLLFTSPRDMLNFAAYTAETVMIMGFNTATQLIEKGVEPSHARPWVVLSSESFIKHRSPNIFYVDNMPMAYEIAEDLCHNHARLIGWTIIGGAKVFEAVIESLAKTLHLTSYYMCLIDAPAEKSTAAGPFLKLSKNAAELETLLKRNMIDAQTRSVVADVMISDSEGAALRASCAFKIVNDRGVFDDTGIDVRGQSLIIEAAHSGTLHIPFKVITGFNEEHGKDVITIYTSDCEVHTIRLESGKPGLAFLKQQLTIILNER